MVKQININGIGDIKKLNQMATAHDGEVGIHTETVIVDAKSLLALLALDYSKKVVCVTENENFYNRIKDLIAE